ncbi:hypothetical protein EI94DRAFT_321437 [Lactarius quietus]|nr:hypothetical protein EI94DRAFT_321437 [Lactarius quietus]
MHVMPHSDQKFPPPPITRQATRIVLPALKELFLSTVCEYAEEFVARIDTPQLDLITIDYWDQDIDFEVPHLSEFLNRSEDFKETLSNKCEVLLRDDEIVFAVISGTTATDKAGCWYSDAGICFHVLSERESLDQSISHLNHVLNSISPILSGMVHLYLHADALEGFLDEIEWSQFFSQFTTVRTLSVFGNIAHFVSYALEGIAEEMVTEVLPALELLCLEGRAVSSLEEKFGKTLQSSR